MSGPPNKWNEYKNIGNLSSQQVDDLIDNEAGLGNSDALYVPCADGDFLFFGNYANAAPAAKAAPARKNVGSLTAAQVLSLLNNEAALGNTQVLFAPCSDGKFLFFGCNGNS
jgi:hypothetical protein